MGEADGATKSLEEANVVPVKHGGLPGLALKQGTDQVGLVKEPRPNPEEDRLR